MFVKEKIVFPSILEREYEGFPPDGNIDSIYRSYWKIKTPRYLNQSKNPIQIPLIIIINRNSWISEKMFALQGAGLAVIVTDDYLDYKDLGFVCHEKISDIDIQFITKTMLNN